MTVTATRIVFFPQTFDHCIGRINNYQGQNDINYYILCHLLNAFSLTSITFYPISIAFYPIPIAFYPIPIAFYPIPIAFYPIPIAFYPIPIRMSLIQVEFYIEVLIFGQYATQKAVFPATIFF